MQYILCLTSCQYYGQGCQLFWGLWTFSILLYPTQLMVLIFIQVVIRVMEPHLSCFHLHMINENLWISFQEYLFIVFLFRAVNLIKDWEDVLRNVVQRHSCSILGKSLEDRQRFSGRCSCLSKHWSWSTNNHKCYSLYF